MRTEVLQHDDRLKNNALADKLNTLDDTLESVILDLRHLVNRLRPEMLESLGIINTMSYEVAQFRKSTGLATSFTSNERDLALNPDSSIALYRILQEALSNIRRHAQASEVTVRFECSGGSLSLQVEDNGRGFSPENPHTTIPYGILSMQERALLLGGSFSIVRTPRQTTLVEVRIPLDTRSQAGQP
jgi:signal transduction histidine kinase